MTWTFSKTATLASLMDRCTEPYVLTTHTITFALFGEQAGGEYVLWSVRETTRGNGIVLPRWIGCDVIDHSSTGELGVKHLDESMAPNYYDCPLRFLDMAPPAGSIGERWRRMVRLYHANPPHGSIELIPPR